MLKEVSYLKKTIIMNTTIITSIICIFVLVYGWSQTRNIKNNTDSTMIQLTTKAASQFNGILDEMSNISLGIAGNPYVYEALEDTLYWHSPLNYFQSHLEEKKMIQREVVALCGTHFANKSFNVISRGYDCLELNTYDFKMYTKEDIRNVSWIRHVMENDINKYISPVGKDEYGRANEDTFSFIRKIQNEYNEYGVIDVQYEKIFLDEIFTMKLQEKKMHMMVFDEDGLFYASDNIPLEFSGRKDVLKESFSKAESLQDVLLQGEKYRVCYTFVEPYKMDVYALVRSEDYLGPVKASLRAIILFGLAVLSGMLVIVYFVSYNLHKPLRQLRDTIEHMDYASLSHELHINSNNNEIILLTEAFDKMVEGIKRTRDELVESRIREIKANYQVLQEQINPHFMHNILSVIGLMGFQKNAPEIMEICAELTQMLRYSTGTGKYTVKVSEEAEHATTYLRLMKYRHLDMLQYTVTIDEKLKEVTIPKFILQPLVENCFQHSFQNQNESKYIIVVSGQMTETGWAIAVEDNGEGFTREAIHKLERQFEEIRNRLRNGKTIKDSQIGGLALINTYARLYLYSNGQMDIKIAKSNMGGACVTVVYDREQS